MFVFGINIPLVEVLFILVVILIVFVVLVFLQFRSLRKMILVEQKDIGHLETGLSKLNIKSPKSTPVVEEFIKTSLKKGYSTQNIRGALVKQNWPREIIDTIFHKVSGK